MRFLQSRSGKALFLCALAFLSVSLSGPVHKQGAPAWQIELVDQRPEEWRGVWSTSLALDSDGHPHTSYCGAGAEYERNQDELRYAYSDGAVWQITAVDSSGCNGTSLQLDSAGHPSVSYTDGPNGHLKYAQYDGASWQAEIVDGAGDVGYLTSLALNAGDEPRVAYVDVNGILKYASRDGSAWTLESVGKPTVDFTSVSLALDSYGYPHISYAVWTGSSATDLRYTSFDGSSWQAALVEGGGMVGDDTSLVLDSLDRPHISYCAVDSAIEICSALKYAYQDNRSWTIETVPDTGLVGAFSSLRLDAAADPHISYCLSGQLGCDELRYAWRENGVWYIEEVDKSGGDYGALVLDTNGQPHISYSSSGALKYAYRLQMLLPDTGRPSEKPVLIAAITLLGLGLLLRYSACKRARREP